MTEPAGLREDAIEWLRARTHDGDIPLTREDIADYQFNGHAVRLISTQQGILKPRGFVGALSFRTSYTPPGKKRPYEDEAGTDGLIRYAWREDGYGHHENVGLRRAMELQLPMIWFVGIGGRPRRFKGDTRPPLYQVVAPVYVVAEEVEHQRFLLATTDDIALLPQGGESPPEEMLRRYLLRQSKVRLHQPVFRSSVLAAYENHCAVCNLGHPRLLDAAHIVADGDERGIASVVNGIALCKIHHAAFDGRFMGIRPDTIVEIRRDLLEEIDGPMLRHGLQDLHGKPLMKLPPVKSQRPRRDLLEIAYQRFQSATVDDVA